MNCQAPHARGRTSQRLQGSRIPAIPRLTPLVGPAIRTWVCAGLTLAQACHGQGAEPARPAPAATAQVLVVYYSRTGNTEQMARGVAEGIRRVSGVTAVVRKVGEVSKEELQAADGLVLGCPTYFANLPGEMKTALDEWNWKWKVDFTDKVGGAFATAGGQVGGQGHVVVSLLLFMLHNRMIVAGPLYRNEQTGSVWAESGAAAITGPLDAGVRDAELDGARRLGERVATLARRLKTQAASGGKT